MRDRVRLWQEFEDCCAEKSSVWILRGGLGELVLNLWGVVFCVDGGSGSGILDGELMILASVVLDVDFGRKVVFMGIWSWGTTVNAGDKESLESLALVVLIFFDSKASSSPYLLHFNRVCSSSLSSSSFSLSSFVLLSPLH